MGLDLINDFPNNPDVTSDLSVGAINNTQLPGYENTDPYNQQLIDNSNQTGDFAGNDPYAEALLAQYNSQFTPEAIGPQGAALYPGLKHNINVGSQSGRIIGSQNIYVPGGDIMAIDPVLARRKAIDDAARKKAATLKPFEYADPYKLKDARFQETFNKAYYDRANKIIDEAKQKYGKDFSVILSDQNTREGRKFIQEMSNYEVLGREFDQIVDFMAEMDKGLQSKEKEYTPETLALKKEFEQLVGNFENGDIFSSKDLKGMYDKLKGHRSFEDYIQTENFLSDISGITNQYAYDKATDQYFKYGTNETVKFEDAIKEVVDSLESTVFAPEVAAGTYDKDYMYKAIRARLKDSFKQTGTISQKTAATLGAETEEFIASPDGIVKYVDEDGLRGKTQLFKYNPITGKRIPITDKDGNVTGYETWNIASLADAQLSISGKTQSIKERTPDGKIQSVESKGIPLNNVRVVGPDGKEQTITGNVIAEMDNTNMTKLDDGRIVIKAKVWVPTKATKKEGGYGEEAGFDAFTQQDQLIIIEDKEGRGAGGAKTQIRERGLKSEDSKNAFHENVKVLREYTGKKEKTPPKKGEPGWTEMQEGGKKPKVDEFGVPI
jgi:hypothetical protein